MPPTIDDDDIELIDLNPEINPDVDPDRLERPEPGAEDTPDEGEQPKPRKTADDGDARLKRARADAKRAKRERDEFARRMAEQSSVNEAILQELRAHREVISGQQTAAQQRAEEEARASHAAAEAELEAAYAEADPKRIAKATTRLQVATSLALDFERGRGQRQAERDEPRRQPQRQEQAQQTPAWVDDWRAEHDWFDPQSTDREEKIDSRLATEVSIDISQRGIPPGDPRHREELDKELRRRLPHRYGVNPQRERPRPTAAGSPRGGSANAATSKVPEAVWERWREVGIEEKALARGEKLADFRKRMEANYLASRAAGNER